MSTYQAVSERVEDGSIVTLPNNVEEIEVSAFRSGYHWILWLQTVAKADGRVGTSDFRVSVTDVQESGAFDAPDSSEYSFVLHLKQARFLYVTLTAVSDQ